MLPDNLKVFTKENCFRKDSHNISITKTMYIDKKDITYRTVIDGKVLPKDILRLTLYGT